MDIFSVVFQDFKLFALPLGENVSAGRAYHAEQVEDCLKKAGFSNRLDKMPEGLNTYLYKEYDKTGVDISGGEAQKIAIARALYKDAPFLILDEPTAALDPIAGGRDLRETQRDCRRQDGDLYQPPPVFL